MWKPGETAGKGGFQFWQNVKVPQRKGALSHHIFGWEGSPKIDCRKKLVPLF